MDISEFLLDRVRDLEVRTEFIESEGDDDEQTTDILYAMVNAIRETVKWHGNWPVLVEKKPEYSMADAFDPDVNNLVFKMSQEITWFTENEYIKRFGTAPASAPILKILAQPWKTHPDFQREWLLA